MSSLAVTSQGPQFLEDVRSKIASHMGCDPYGNCHIDVTDVPELKDKFYARAFRQLLPEYIESAKAKGLHMFTVKFSSECDRLPKYVQREGLHLHFADRDKMLAKKCLQNHSEEECTYPAYKTISFGITSVVFNKDLTEFVAIKEKKGPYLGFKAVTGTVDYEKQETPLAASARELGEETGVHVDVSDAVFVGLSWTPNFRDGKPDANLVFAFSVEKKDQHLEAQEAEVGEVTWLSVAKFLASDLPVKHSKSLILKRVVEAARQALKTNPNSHVQHLAWGSGKDLEFYSSVPGFSFIETLKKWKGRVIGNEEEILEALEKLGREPTDFKELEDLIFEERTQKLNELLENAPYSYIDME